MKSRLTRRLKSLIRCFFLVFAITFNFVACEMNDDNESRFEPVEYDLYKLDTVIRSRCFDPAYNPDNSIENIIPQNSVLRIDDTTFRATIFKGYNCNAIDSISLIGNQLELFLKSEDSNCSCLYEWELTFTMTENKWFRVEIFLFEDNDYKSHGFITSNLEDY
ncbi:MAG: hypothetical protein JW798_02170 [Prolixibacteraceae bacterium]|nr:hypothetical protein [Prolixibacteraceae bacterium]